MENFEILIYDKYRDCFDEIVKSVGARIVKEDSVSASSASWVTIEVTSALDAYFLGKAYERAISSWVNNAGKLHKQNERFVI